ncbi:MAG: Hsp70 family protein [Syntrophobacteria bacterium]
MDTPFDHEDVSYRYVVGIDLGTTNSAVAYADLTAGERQGRRIHFLNIPQLTAPGEVGNRSILPSFLYLPGPYELPPGSTALPWDSERYWAVGEFAREQGALVPGRLVASAKSWLCHGGVDRTAAILPWAAVSDVEKISPVEASSRYLQHIREAWNHVVAGGREGHLLEEQLIILTVPASFDEVARELTVRAAQTAGLPRVVLVEEPLAAFYSWLYRHQQDWQSRMQPGQLILVCDVGGGTTDFTVIAVKEGERGLRFDRLAVGDHLMLGGDNMDLTLARELETRLLGKPGQLDSRRWHQLCHQCRKAKELVLGSPGEHPSADIAVAGSGGKLIAGTLKGTLTLALVEELILEGFFPFVSLEDTPGQARRTGLAEWGLPYVQDPAVTRHLAAFWQDYRHLLREETGRAVLYPEFLLFNGAALTPGTIRNRILDAVQLWFQEEAGESWRPEELHNPSPELAVAFGAAYYGLVRQGEGVRVGAGSPRAYYVEVAAGREEAPDTGMYTAVCLVPRGSEEGFEAQLSEPAFQVLANRPVVFQLFSSSTRLADRMGDLLSLDEEEVSILPPIRTVLRYGKRAGARTLPVQLAVRLSEVGTLELWCQSQASSHRWQLQFDVRQQGEPSAPGPVAGETIDMALIEQAQDRIRAAFQRGKTPHAASPQSLVKDLVSILGLNKGQWSTAVIRKLADSLLECEKGRGRTPEHESRWFNLLGFCLRPGYGDPVDEWRIRGVWKIFHQGLRFPTQGQCRSEWWVFWRRVAGGLSAGKQWHIYQQVSAHVQIQRKQKAAKKSAKRLSVHEELELCMTLASFERLPPETKVELGQFILEKIQRGKPRNQDLWSLSRLGARIPFYGPVDRVIPRQQASVWLNALLDVNLTATRALALSLVQLARLTGDRQRDLPQSDLERLSRWLEKAPGGAHYSQLLTQPATSLSEQERDWIFGEALPSGLVLASED